MKLAWTWSSGGKELKSKSALRLILLGLGVLFVGALLLDLRGAMRKRQGELRRLAALERPEALMPGVDDTRYVDPEGRFAITLPTPWVRISGVAADPYTAVFRGPRRIDISVVVTPLNHDRFDLLLAQIRHKMDSLDLKSAQLTTIKFQGRPAVERQAVLPRSRVYTLDFLEGHVGHHIVVSMPHEDYDRLLPVVKEILETYEAPAGRRGGPAAADATEHAGNLPAQPTSVSPPVSPPPGNAAPHPTDATDQAQPPVRSETAD